MKSKIKLFITRIKQPDSPCHNLYLRFKKGCGLLLCDIKQIRLPLCILLIYGIITQLFFGTICPFAILFGYPCPGCGLTRAGLCLLCGKFSLAAKQNAAIYLWMPFLLYLLFFRYIKLKKPPFLFPAAVLISIATFAGYFYRIYTGTLGTLQPFPRGILTLFY